MPLSQEHQEELLRFQKEVEQHNPQNVVQFAVNYFNKRLEKQREFPKKHKGSGLSKESNSLPEYINQDPLEPKRPVEDQTSFTPSFTDHDSHLDPLTENTERLSFFQNVKEHSRKGRDMGMFKGDFQLGKELNTTQSILEATDSKFKCKNSRAFDSRNSQKTTDFFPVDFDLVRRPSVSAETLDFSSLDELKVKSFNEKSQDQIKRLLEAVNNNFLFNQLDSDSRVLVLNSLEEKTAIAGEEIIRQGDEGDYFYILESGNVEFSVNKAYVSSSGPGSCFGELALMYNSPRAATVTATADCKLWRLDRLTFRGILLSCSFSNRLLYDNFLKSMSLLKSLSSHDREKLAQALNSEYYEPGDKIICEGDFGENFYFIEYGDVDVIKKDKGVVARLSHGDYFGEIALLNNMPRQSTVTAITKTKVATVGKSGFQRLLGPVIDVLKQNASSYSDQ